MKKDWTRDYATEIFRSWAAAGKPTYEYERDRIRAAALTKHSMASAETALVQAEKAVEAAAPHLMDVLAAERTVALLKKGKKDYIVKALEAVYFVQPSEPLRRGEITERVRRFAVRYHADERVVFRWLKEARLLCAASRGLKISEGDKTNYKIE